MCILLLCLLLALRGRIATTACKALTWDTISMTASLLLAFSARADRVSWRCCVMDGPSRGAPRPLEFCWRASLSPQTAAAARFSVQLGTIYTGVKGCRLSGLSFRSWGFSVYC